MSDVVTVWLDALDQGIQTGLRMAAILIREAPATLSREDLASECEKLADNPPPKDPT